MAIQQKKKVMLFQTCMIFCLLQNRNKDILKNTEVKTTLDLTDFHYEDKKYWTLVNVRQRPTRNRRIVE